jgi:hypothetical protein
LEGLSVAQSTPARYRIYLLTIWSEQSHDAQTPRQWRFSLAHPPTGQHQGFASLAALVAALQELMSEQERSISERGQQNDTNCRSKNRGIMR